MRSLQRPVSKWWYFAAGLGLGFVLALGAGAEAASLSSKTAESSRNERQVEMTSSLTSVKPIDSATWLEP